VQAEVARRFAGLERSGEMAKVLSRAQSDEEQVRMVLERLR
jgi:hypothetical protein